MSGFASMSGIPGRDGGLTTAERQRLKELERENREPRQPDGCKLKTAPVRPVVAARSQNMYALRTCFIKDSSSYVDPQKYSSRSALCWC